MQERFYFSPGDVIRYQRFGARHLPRRQRLQLPVYQFLFAALLFWGVAAVFSLYLLPATVPIQLRFVMFGGATIFGGIFLLMGTLLMLVVLNIGVYPWLRGEQSLAISPSGVAYHNQRGEQSLTWQEVLRIQQDQYNLYFLLACKGFLAQAMPGEMTLLYMKSNDFLGLNRVYIIPKRAFTQPLEAEQFLDLAISFLGDAHLTSSAISDSRLAS